MKRFLVLTLLGVIGASSGMGVARADWDPGDGHKMHYPQMPDPTGWDVKVTPNLVLADDWQCSSTGPVTDIHFWSSWRNGTVGGVSGIWVGIFSNVPVGPGVSYSRPGDLLWQETFTPGVPRAYDPPSLEGWYNPAIPEALADNHQSYYQYNIQNIANPFVQVQGTVYWLAIQATLVDPVNTDFGWKTSIDHFEDDAVWGNWGGVGPFPASIAWNELLDPQTLESLDLAFVITPEPGSVLAMIGVLGWALAAGRRPA